MSFNKNKNSAQREETGELVNTLKFLHILHSKTAMLAICEVTNNQVPRFNSSVFLKGQ